MLPLSRAMAAGLSVCLSSLSTVDRACAADSTTVLSSLEQKGSTVQATGEEHGLSTYFVRKDGHFMVVNLAPDGQAIVSGLVLQASVAQLMSASSSRLTELPRLHGLRSFFLRTDNRFQVFYATPDEKRLIAGVMWDASGKNLTRQQIARVSGAVPTVEMPRHSTADSEPAAAQAGDVFASLSASHFGTFGKPEAPLAWMVVDPECTFSERALEELTPAVNAGRLRLAVIPVSILDREDGGASTTKALGMLSLPAAAMVSAWAAHVLPDGDASATGAQLDANMRLASHLGLKGTPTFVWRRADGSLGREDGMPSSPDELLTNMGA